MAKFFHTPKPRKFNLQPRYWDPEKEEREARDRRINAEMGIKEDGDFKPHISKGDFRKGLSDGKWSVGAQRRKSNNRLVILFVIAAVLLWLMLK